MRSAVVPDGQASKLGVPTGCRVVAVQGIPIYEGKHDTYNARGQKNRGGHVPEQMTAIISHLRSCGSSTVEIELSKNIDDGELACGYVLGVGHLVLVRRAGLWVI